MTNEGNRSRECSQACYPSEGRVEILELEAPGAYAADSSSVAQNPDEAYVLKQIHTVFG
jgi:hypothetical protein